jgi:hypothetical protein
MVITRHNILVGFRMVTTRRNSVLSQKYHTEARLQADQHHDKKTALPP